MYFISAFERWNAVDTDQILLQYIDQWIFQIFYRVHSVWFSNFKSIAFLLKAVRELLGYMYFIEDFNILPEKESKIKIYPC